MAFINTIAGSPLATPMMIKINPAIIKAAGTATFLDIFIDDIFPLLFAVTAVSHIADYFAFAVNDE